MSEASGACFISGASHVENQPNAAFRWVIPQPSPEPEPSILCETGIKLLVSFV